MLSGNDGSGIFIYLSDGWTIQGNLIGADVTGTAPSELRLRHLPRIEREH